MINLKDIKSVKHISDPTEEKLNDLKLVSQETDKEIVSAQGENTKDILRARSIERLDDLEAGSEAFDNKIGERDTSVAEELTEITDRTEKVISDSEKYTEDIEAFLSVAKGDDFLFFLDDLTVQIGRLDNLTNGNHLFYSNKNIKEWSIPLPSLVDGNSMFYHCYSLSSWNVELPLLKSADAMFDTCPITDWNIDLPELTNGNSMFTFCRRLVNFSGNLQNLTSGRIMFNLCKLSLASVQNIANTINDLASDGKSGNITIGMAANLQGNSELAEALAAIVAKGWTVTEQYNL